MGESMHRADDGPDGPRPAALGGSASVDWGEGDWQAIAESLPHMVWLATPDGRTVYANARGLAYAGLPFDEITWRSLIHPDDLPMVVAGWSAAIEAGTPFDADYRLRRYDGSYRWHACHSLPVQDGEGRIVRWLGTATDIDDRIEVEAELRAARREAVQAMNLLATLQAAAPVGLAFVDRDLRVVRVNDAIGGFTNLRADQQVGRTVPELLPELWEHLEPLYRRVLDAGESVLNLPFSRPGPEVDDPSREWVANLYPVRVDDEIVGVGLVVVDITERVQAERFRSTVMSQVIEGVYTQDGQGRLTYLNRAASRMLGWSEAELQGRSLHEVVHHQRIDGTPLSLDECPLCAPGGDRRELRASGVAFTRKDGRRFPVACSTLPLGSETEPEGASVVFRDISAPGQAPNLIRVLLVADGESEAALTAVLTHHDGFDVVSSATTPESAVDQARHLDPDVVLVDAGLPGSEWVQTVRRIVTEAPHAVVLLLAPDDDEALAAAAIAGGCAGAVDTRRLWVDLANSVRAAHHGEVTISQAQLQKVVTAVRGSRQPAQVDHLTRREREVLACMMHGLSNQQVADQLSITINTVRNHVQRILYKLDVHSRLEAVVAAARDGILDEPS